MLELDWLYCRLMPLIHLIQTELEQIRKTLIKIKAGFGSVELMNAALRLSLRAIRSDFLSLIPIHSDFRIHWIKAATNVRFMKLAATEMDST